jgi:hypothetical protein
MSSKETALMRAIEEAIAAVGLGAFKATSMFMSSHRKHADQKAAA